MGFNISNMRFAKVVRTTNVSVAVSGTPQTISFESAIKNANGLWVLATNPSRITANRPGWYLVVATAEFAASATGDRELRVIKNGSATAILAFSGVKSATLITSLTAVGFVYLGVGDYIEMVVNQTSGGALDLVGTAAHESPSLSLALVLPESISSGAYERE